MMPCTNWRVREEIDTVIETFKVAGGRSADRPALTGHEDSSLGLGFIGFTMVV